jgi:hypothetical protein
MKKEYQYLIAGAALSTAVLLGMGNVGGEKQVAEGRYQFLDNVGDLYNNPSIAIVGPQYDSDSRTNTNLFGVIDSQTGTVSYVDISGQTIVFPFAATKAE